MHEHDDRGGRDAGEVYCRGCGQRLVIPRAGDPPSTPAHTPPTSPATDTRTCPECGRAFDPRDARTLDTVGPTRRRHDLLVGVLVALGVAVAAVAVPYGLYQIRFGSFGPAFAAHAIAGLALGVVASVLAGLNRSWIAIPLLLLASTLAIWIGIFTAVDHGFRAWQSMPDPPPEAFNDGAQGMAGLLLGWVPGAIVTAIVFVPVRLVWRIAPRMHR